jgi:peptide/nickel transport system substrate-binding protein
MALINRTTQLRMRRILRRKQRQVEAITEAAEKTIDRNLIGRFDRLIRVRRFVSTWIILLLLAVGCTFAQTVSLSGYYQTLQPVPGGIYNEGMVGTYSNANPIFATGAADIAISRLVFAGLLKYNEQNQLVSDLASSYTVDSTGKHYVVYLKPNLTWQDGKPLTANDVAFTYHLIQNPDAQSPLLGAWQGITVTAPAPNTINFDLPNAFSAFPYSLITGIVPQHRLAKIPAAQLRSHNFNTTEPVGAGPFAWQAIQLSSTTDPSKSSSLIALKPFSNYVNGAPKLSGFVLHTFGSEEQLVDAFKKRDINAAAGLTTMPNELAGKTDVHSLNFPSTAALMTFFKTSSGVLADAQVRQSLVQSVNVPEMIHKLGYTTKPVREPFLSTQFGYDPAYEQPDYDLGAANKRLDQAGWARGNDGVRSKSGQKLTFRIYAENTPENQQTVQQLQAYWKKVGADVQPVLQDLTDFQTTLEFHTYDALLYGISIGPDPDVFAYWDSSQADVRSYSHLNFSEYKSASADAALESGRTRLNPTLRTVKYRPFLAAWQTDAPALGLYQPRFLYVTRGPVYGLREHTLNTDSDRYQSVNDWEIHTAKVTD